MNAVKAIYHNGKIKFIEKPAVQEATEVLVIFPDKNKKISKIGGLFKGHVVNYDAVELELKKLSLDSQNHILDEAGGQA